jgi:biotin synthase
METTLADTLDDLVRQALSGKTPDREQALAVLTSSDDELLEVVAAGGRVRRHFFANRVKLNLIINMKSGLCPEDCSYCSQRRGSDADVLKYNWVDPSSAAETADRAIAGGAKRICLVASGRGPSDRDVTRVAETVRVIKERHPDVEICTSLGLLTAGRAEQLAEAGVFAYNHNLNTSEANYAEICSTHTYADRIETVGVAQMAGLSPCSGAIFGMGETDEEIVDLAFDLRKVR